MPHLPVSYVPTVPPEPHRNCARTALFNHWNTLKRHSNSKSALKSLWIIFDNIWELLWNRTGTAPEPHYLTTGTRWNGTQTPNLLSNHSESFLTTFENCSETALKLLCNWTVWPLEHAETALKLQMCSELTLNHFWHYLRAALKLLWNCSETALKPHRQLEQEPPKPNQIMLK